MSTFRLFGPNISISVRLQAEARNGHLHLTTGTFNLLSKTEIACPAKSPTFFRLSGASSVRPDSTEGIRPSPKPFKTIRFHKRCQPVAVTGFPPVFNSRGVQIQSIKSNLENSFERARKRSPARSGRKIRRTRKRKTNQKLKIAWRFCYTRKPFRELSPRMRTPERG